MKYPLDKKKRYIITTEMIQDNRLVFFDKYKYIYIYEMDIETGNLFVYENIRFIQYLDLFVVMMPNEYDLKEKLWTCFYEYFGEMYDLLITKSNNLACIDGMIKYIEQRAGNHSSLILLDYGCGNGLSAELENNHTLYGYDPIEIMRKQARMKGMKVYGKSDLMDIPNEFFDGVFSSYVFHLSLCEEDILKVFPKMKANASWIVNFYKGINEEYMNGIFLKNGFIIQKIYLQSERFGSVYEYRKRIL